MKINKFFITEEFLNAMKKDEKVFSVLLGYFLNEINILIKCTRIKHPKAPPGTPEGMAYLCFSLMFVRLIAAKLYEAWKFIKRWDTGSTDKKSRISNLFEGLRVVKAWYKRDKDKTSLKSKLIEVWSVIKAGYVAGKNKRSLKSKSGVWKAIKEWYEKNRKAYFLEAALPKFLEDVLLSETKETWEKIDDYFKNPDNILKYIRNKAGFHYDKKLIKKGLGQLEVLKNKEALTYFTSEYAENSLFVFSDMIILQALKQRICPKKSCPEICQETSTGFCQNGEIPILKKFFEETEMVLLLFHQFSMNCIDEIKETNKHKLNSVQISIIPEPPINKEINFPFFLRRN